MCSFSCSLSPLSNPLDPLLPVAFAHGLTIMVLIIGLGHISGGHFNPAVTLAIFVCGKISIMKAIAYMIVQLFGGFVGALLVRLILADRDYYASAVLGGATIVPDPIYEYWWQAMACEAVLTYILVSTVLLSAVDATDNLLAPLGIGLTLTLDIIAGGRVSGASMNPARSFGPCIATTIFARNQITVAVIWKEHYVYWAGPIIGALIAAAIYKLFLGNENIRIVGRSTNKHYGNHRYVVSDGAAVGVPVMQMQTTVAVVS